MRLPALWLSRVKKFWSVPLGLLLASLLGIIALVSLPVGARSAGRGGPGGEAREGSRTELEEVAGSLARTETARREKSAELRSALGELQLLLGLLSAPGSSAPQAKAVEEMRQAAGRVREAFSLAAGGSDGREAEPMRESEEAFRAAAAQLGKLASIPREHALAEEAERQFQRVLTLGREVQRLETEQASSFADLKTVTAGVNGSARPRSEAMAAGAWEPWRRWLLAFLAGTSFVCSLAAMVANRRQARDSAKYLVAIAREVARGAGRRRASLEEAGELRPLAEALNQLIEARQQAEERLRLAHDSLELKVSARTAALWSANVALRAESEQRARAEGQFYQSQKMDALGKLSGAIAHDFNNLLTVILGGVEAVQRQLGAADPGRAQLQTVLQAAERAANLTRPLLTFSRSQVLEVEVVNLNEAAEEAARMLHRLLGVNIELRLNLAPEAPRVKINANQLQQVLMNLGVNARDAMSGIGILTLATRHAELDEEIRQRHGLTPESEWVEVVVQDTGSGMDAATKARIFEPFFTTKGVGKGTGLGLATVFGIVKQSGGFLEVESAVGEGTSFRVFLPATEETTEAPVADPVPEEVPAKRSTGQQTVLLVDDEEDIRTLATFALEEEGYRVLAASHAEEAILLAEKHASEIRALISDVVMPGINGVQLAEVVGRLVPNLKLLFVSGHSNETISPDTLQTSGAAYLQKPYRTAAFVAKVREVLNGG